MTTITALPTPPARTMTSEAFVTAADNFMGALPTFATQTNAVASEINTMAAAMSLNATTDTSATSNTIGTGAKTFTVTAGKSFVPGMWLTIVDTAAPTTNGMFAQVASYSTTSLVVNVTGTMGSGTKTAWTIAQSAPYDFSVVQGQGRIKNDIVNGQFRIAQAGTNFVAPVSGAYDLDGWLNGNPSSAVFTVAQVAGETAGKFARQVTVTTADASVAAGDFVFDETRIEGYNIVKYVGNTFTVAFRAKVPVAGIHCVYLKSGSVDRTYVHEINFPVANVFQDCSVTVTGGLPTAGTWNYTNWVGIYVGFVHMSGSTYQTTADSWNTGNFLATANQVNDCATIGNVWALQDVRIALGTYCPPDDSSYDENLVYSQRYCEEVYVHFYGNAATSGSAVSAVAPTKVSKRTRPTIFSTTLVGATTNFTLYDHIIDDNGNEITYGTGTAAGGVEFCYKHLLVSRL